MRGKRIGKLGPVGRQWVESQPAPSKTKTDLMTPAILFAFASAVFLGAGVVTTQFGVCAPSNRCRGPRSASPASRCCSCCSRQLILHGEPVVWRGLPIFAAIGLFFPAMLTFLTFASNRALGPVITSTLGNLAPLFAVTTSGRAAA